MQTPVVARLRSIPGIGLMTATALVAFIGDIVRFPSGREFASYLGLTPREYSSGLRQRLGRISKRGDSYLRMLLVHGARSVLCHAKKGQDSRCPPHLGPETPESDPAQQGCRRSREQARAHRVGGVEERPRVPVDAVAA